MIRKQPPRYWYENGQPPLPMRLLAGVYGHAISVRAALYRRQILRSERVEKPVLVVGNLIVGGSGKTPLTIAIVQRLREAGWLPGVASRGYGRRDPGATHWVDANSDPRLCGDEPVLIARRTGAKLRVDRDRVAAARSLIDAGCDIVVCDDGLQHYGLTRDVEIEVIDGRRRYGNGRLLPAGPLREPVERGRRCDFKVVNLGSDHAETNFGEWPMRMIAGDAVALQGNRTRPLSSFSGQRVHAIAGIGDPARFFDTLRAYGIAVVPHAFVDHHHYTAEDMRFGSDLPVLMTEKDAVKCAPFANDRCWSVPVRAELPEAFWVALLDRLQATKTAGVTEMTRP